jgi:hypothetical protein
MFDTGPLDTESRAAASILTKEGNFEMLRSSIFAVLLSSVIACSAYAASDRADDDAGTAEAYAWAEAKWVRAERDRANAEMNQIHSSDETLAQTGSDQSESPPMGN